MIKNSYSKYNNLHLLAMVALIILFSNCSSKDSSLIAWWDFDSIHENIVQDRSGNNLHAYGYNALFAPGKNGKAFYSNGTNYLQVKYTPKLDDFKRGLTLSVWIYRNRDAGNDYNCIITRQIRNTISEYFDIAILKNKPLFAIDPDGNHYHQTDYKGTFLLHQWYHLAGTFDNTTYTLFINGEPVASGEQRLPFHFDDKNPVIIGSNTNDQGKIMHDNFYGLIDELKIFNRALTSNEIMAIFKKDN